MHVCVLLKYTYHHAYRYMFGAIQVIVSIPLHVYLLPWYIFLKLPHLLGHVRQRGRNNNKASRAKKFDVFLRASEAWMKTFVVGSLAIPYPYFLWIRSVCFVDSMLHVDSLLKNAGLGLINIRVWLVWLNYSQAFRRSFAHCAEFLNIYRIHMCYG